jgi:hypothetical protein
LVGLPRSLQAKGDASFKRWRMRAYTVPFALPVHPEI